MAKIEFSIGGEVRDMEINIGLIVRHEGLCYFVHVNEDELHDELGAYIYELEETGSYLAKELIGTPEPTSWRYTAGQAIIWVADSIRDLFGYSEEFVVNLEITPYIIQEVPMSYEYLNSIAAVESLREST